MMQKLVVVALTVYQLHVAYRLSTACYAYGLHFQMKLTWRGE